MKRLLVLLGVVSTLLITGCDSVPEGTTQPEASPVVQPNEPVLTSTPAPAFTPEPKCANPPAHGWQASGRLVHINMNLGKDYGEMIWIIELDQEPFPSKADVVLVQPNPENPDVGDVLAGFSVDFGEKLKEGSVFSLSLTEPWNGTSATLHVLSCQSGLYMKFEQPKEWEERQG